MSVSCFFTHTSGFPGLLATFILTVGRTDGRVKIWAKNYVFSKFLNFFFMFFLNCFASPQKIFKDKIGKKLKKSNFKKLQKVLKNCYFLRHFRQKIMFFQNFSKSFLYFFLIVSLSLRRHFQTKSVKIKKKLKKSNFKKISNILKKFNFLRHFRQKIMLFRNFSKFFLYFFLVISPPLRRLSKTKFMKN